MLGGMFVTDSVIKCFRPDDLMHDVIS